MDCDAFTDAAVRRNNARLRPLGWRDFLDLASLSANDSRRRQSIRLAAFQMSAFKNILLDVSAVTDIKIRSVYRCQTL